MLLDSVSIEQLDERYRTRLINSLSGFKSANLVGTCNKHQQTNLAIFTSVVHIGAHPPLLGMVNRPHTVPRDTLENILALGYYTINHVNRENYLQAHQTSARYINQSEFAATGLTAEWKADFPAPYVGECNIQLGMKLREHLHIQTNNTEMLIGEIVQIHIPEKLVADDGYLDLEQAGSLTVSSLEGYHRTELLERLAYAKP